MIDKQLKSVPASPEFQVIDKFCCGTQWRFYDDLKEKEIYFAFRPSKEEKENWIKYGFTKLRHMLSCMKKEYDGLENFELLFFKGKHFAPYYKTTENGKNWVKINFDVYVKYGKKIDSAVNELRLNKYSHKIWGDFSKKVPQHFFKGKSPNALVNELKNSYYNILENLIKEFDRMTAEQKMKLKKALEHSPLGTEIIKEYVKLKPKAPKIQLKTFIEVIEKLGEEEVGELLNSLLKSKVSRLFIKQLSKLSRRDQNKIIKKLPEMSKMMDRYEKLQRSLRKFKKQIKRHQDSVKKDEKAIHKLLAKDYWLLGIEYFDKKILSDITPDGKLTGDTKIGKRKHADFIIERIDGLDKCVLIELEEANDPIFNKDGTLSKKVYDGINQAVDYYIEQTSLGYNSKGIAVIGALSGTRLTKVQKEKLTLLKESFHNVEVLTYNDIIKKAGNTLHFWKSYEPAE